MRSIPVTVLLILGVTALTACQKKDSAQATPRIVKTVVVKPAEVSTTSSITGSVAARVQSDLSFRVSGRITERLVDVGDRVKAGQVLARMDAEEQQADMDIATANLEAAQAQQTQAQLAFDRQQSLFKTQVTTRAAFDAAQETLLTAQGSAKSAQAQLDSAKDALSYTELRADAAGVITARNAEVGQVAQAAQVVFTLAHDGARDAVFNVYESLFLGRKLQPEVTVGLLNDPTGKVEAKVREVSPTIDSSTGTIRIKVGLEGGPDMPLGVPVVASFRSVPEETIELPWSAMASKGGQPAIWVVDPSSSKVSIRPVMVSDYETERFAVTSGVTPGEIVVAEGTKFLRPGEVVSYEGAAK